MDRVSQVSMIEGGEIEPAPELGATVDTDYLLGLAKAESRVRLLLDLDRVLSPGDLGGPA